MTTWSVDSITKFNAETDMALVIFVRYHDGIEENPGLRYLAIRGEGEMSLDWGRSYDVASDIFGRELTWSSIPEYFLRNEGVETDLMGYWQQGIDISSTLDFDVYTDEGAAEIPGVGIEPACWAKIFVHNVGQGDTIVVQLPNGEVWLIDARLYNVSRRNEFLSWIDRRFGFRRFNKVIISHFHYDHIHSIPFILNNFYVDEVLIPDSLPHLTASARRVWTMAGSRLRTGVSTINIYMGQLQVNIIQTSSIADISNEVMRSRDPNFHELVVVLRTPTSKALLSGDIPGNFIQPLLCGYQNCMVNRSLSYYKVSHHGSRTGYDHNFFNCCHPDNSIISCSATNRYGHPHSPPYNFYPGNIEVTCRNGRRVYPYFLR